MIESQRRLAALGLFRRTRITRARARRRNHARRPGHGRGSAGDDDRLRRRAGGRASGFTENRRRRRVRAARVRAAGLLRDRPAQSVRQEPLGQPVHAHQRPADSERHRSGYGFSEYRVLGTFREPRVVRHRGRRVPHRRRSSSRSARASTLPGAASAPSWSRRLTRGSASAAATRFSAPSSSTSTSTPRIKLLIDRLFPQVRLSSFSSGDRRRRPRRCAESVGRALSERERPAGRARDRLGGRLRSSRYLTAQLFRRVPRTNRIVFAASARLGMAIGFARDLADRRGGESDLGPDGARGSPSKTCRRASGSSPAATRPSAALRSISSARPRPSIRTDFRSAATPS